MNKKNVALWVIFVLVMWAMFGPLPGLTAVVIIGGIAAAIKGVVRLFRSKR